MGRYVILTNHKRAVIALVHTVAFLLIAVLLTRTAVRPLRMTSPFPAWLLAAVYLVVSGILTALAAMAGCLRERLYFGLCTASAAFGLMRQVAGDPRMHAAVYIRVGLLASAVVTGAMILRAHRAAVLQVHNVARHAHR
ncbi:MAG TPA: hypothetical protein VE959_37970 [Bryobacteraceae bacterium]|nr:hypothetical protein [Bryobacteraceae bacterium]